MDFGQLEDVDLRKAWKSEPQDFTPWLAENLDRLSSALEIDPPLELIETEKAVEEFWADIVAKSPADGKVALIENQLERSDHTHLGQVLTYLAGTEAKIVIWVAREFAEGHLSAIRWLNDYTSSEFAFFAVRVRVVKIAESPFAPLFDVLERPSDWERTIRSNVILGESELTKFRREFWKHYSDRHPDDEIPEGFKDSNRYEYLESAELYIARYIARGEVGVYIRGNWSEPTEEVESRVGKWVRELQGLGAQEIEGERNVGRFALKWIGLDTRNRSNWDEMADYLHETVGAYRDVLESPPPETVGTGQSG